MRIILDTVDDSCYGDIIISLDEIERLKMGEMIDNVTVYEGRKYYLGIRLNGTWENGKDEDIRNEEDW